MTEYLLPGIVEAEESLSVSSVRQRSIPVFLLHSLLPKMTACDGESRASVSSEPLLSSVETRKISVKVSGYLESLKEFVCLGQAVPNLQIVGSWTMFGAALVMLYLRHLVTDPCQRHNAGLHRWVWTLVCYSCSYLPVL